MSWDYIYTFSSVNSKECDALLLCSLHDLNLPYFMLRVSHLQGLETKYYAKQYKHLHIILPCAKAFYQFHFHAIAFSHIIKLKVEVSLKKKNKGPVIES